MVSNDRLGAIVEPNQPSAFVTEVPPDVPALPSKYQIYSGCLNSRELGGAMADIKNKTHLRP